MQSFRDVVIRPSGQVVPSATVTVHDSDGDLATLYADDDGTTQANPLTADADGAYSFYAANGVYTLTISGRGIQTETVTGVLLEDLSEIASSVMASIPASLHAGIRSGANTTDLSPYIQAFVTSLAGTGKRGIFPPGSYKIATAISVLAKVVLDFSERQAQLLLATQNMNGIEIGDGTDAARSALFGTKLIAPAFAPYPGVAAFASGACIYENYVALVDVERPSFYGLDGSTRKLYQGLKQYRCGECDTPRMIAQEMLGEVVYATGDTGTSNRTVDCNYDFARMLNCAGKGFYWGANTAGLAAYRPTMYGLSGWLFHINATAGPNGQNYFITDIDGEIKAGASGGVYVQSGQRVLVRGGWMGGVSDVPLAVWLGASADTCEVDVAMAPGRIVIDGPANRICGGEVSGDSATAGVGITIGGDDTQVSDGVRVRQWVGTGIGWSGTPARVQIGAIQFKDNGTDVASLAGFSALAAPVVSLGRTSKTAAYVAAATVSVPISQRFVQVTGGTTITTIPPHGLGARLTVQAGAGGIAFNTGGNFGLSSAPLNVPAFKTVSFVCDGVSWFDDGRSF